MLKPVKLGKNERMSFGKIDEVLEMPNLIEVQKKSYEWFLTTGLREIFDDMVPISDHTGNLFLEFIDYSIDETPKYSVTAREIALAMASRLFSIQSASSTLSW